jgi:hypothetical protein
MALVARPACIINTSPTMMRTIGREHFSLHESPTIAYDADAVNDTIAVALGPVFGERLTARELKCQRAEAAIRCADLNRMTRRGMPDSYAVPAC